MAFTFVCDENIIPVGSRKTFDIGGESIIVFHLKDGFFAIQRRCPHMFASLEKGTMTGGQIIQCRIHKAQFDIKTGKTIRWAHFPPGIQALNVLRSQKDLKTYPVKIEDKKVYVEV
ncbi:Rieske (2Fe-2S) protein [bacterium]|nr:Rieske (2Fe-2S) protein [bacterium]